MLPVESVVADELANDICSLPYMPTNEKGNCNWTFVNNFEKQLFSEHLVLHIIAQ